MVITFVTFDPVIRRGGSNDMGVEGLVIRGNGVGNSSDGTNKVEIDDETSGNAF